MNLNRLTVGGVAALLAAASAVFAPTTAPPTASRASDVRIAPSVPVRAVLGVASTVADLDRAIRWYVDVFGCVKLDEREDAGETVERRFGVFPARVRRATLALGDERFELEEFVAPKGRRRDEGVASNDGAFQHMAIVVSDMAAAYGRLRAARVDHLSSGPQRIPDWNESAAGVEAFYFRDVDGHPLELIAFPGDKGDPKWRRPTKAMFLGIDHTAIAVRETAVGLAFYRDLLGLRIAGASENFGIEQDRLNGVFGSRVVITGLRAPAGFGVEFLDYAAPREGRPVEVSRTVADAEARRLVFQVDDVDAAFVAARAASVPLVSAEPIDVVDATGTSARSFLARDPDGRFIEFRGPAAAGATR